MSNWIPRLSTGIPAPLPGTGLLSESTAPLSFSTAIINSSGGSRRSVPTILAVDTVTLSPPGLSCSSNSTFRSFPSDRKRLTTSNRSSVEMRSFRQSPTASTSPAACTVVKFPWFVPYVSSDLSLTFSVTASSSCTVLSSAATAGPRSPTAITDRNIPTRTKKNIRW